MHAERIPLRRARGSSRSATPFVVARVVAAATLLASFASLTGCGSADSNAAPSSSATAPEVPSSSSAAPSTMPSATGRPTAAGSCVLSAVEVIRVTGLPGPATLEEHGSGSPAKVECAYRSASPAVEMIVTQRSSTTGQRREPPPCLDTMAFGGPAQVCAAVSSQGSAGPGSPASTTASVVRFANAKAFDVDVTCSSEAADRPTLIEQTTCWQYMTSIATAYMSAAQVPVTDPAATIPTYPNFPPD